MLDSAARCIPDEATDKAAMSSTLQPLLDAIEASPRARRSVPSSTFDGTIISGYSAIAFIREQLRRGDLSA
jgi:putative phosphoserine phosphatase/1-acylglycerol-3-phosphate O-acyltransferase